MTDIAKQECCLEPHGSAGRLSKLSIFDPNLVIGANREILLPTGRSVKLAGLNNAATTPIFTSTLQALVEFYATYGALHRGAGPNARRTCEMAEKASSSIKNFIGASSGHALLFTSNTSEAINLAARLLQYLTKDRYIVTSDIEHTSNNLPWRMHSNGQILEVPSDSAGRIDLGYFEDLLVRYHNKVALVTLTGASNLTGYIPPIKHIAALAKKAGALLFIDGAQLVPHRPIDMEELGIDILAFSAHKIYAPVGVGVLALPLKLLNQVPPSPGGGSIDMYNSNGGIVWAPSSERHQVGTSNAPGIIALAASIDQLTAIGWSEIISHETKLARELVNRLSKVRGVRIHGESTSYFLEERTGVIPFSFESQHHALTAAILEAEYGIEVRAGTICNHRLVRRWHEVSDAEQALIEQKIANGNRLASYGVVRASLGAHTTLAEIESLTVALENMANTGATFNYRALPKEGRFSITFHNN